MWNRWENPDNVADSMAEGKARDSSKVSKILTKYAVFFPANVEYLIKHKISMKNNCHYLKINNNNNKKRIASLIWRFIIVIKNCVMRPIDNYQGGILSNSSTTTSTAVNDCFWSETFCTCYL